MPAASNCRIGVSSTFYGLAERRAVCIIGTRSCRTTARSRGCLQPQEGKTMKHVTIKTIAVLSGFAAAALLAQSHEASAKNVTSCKGNSRQSVIDCCETLVKKRGYLPYWMKHAGKNCSSAAVCVPGGKPQPATFAAPAKKKCYIKYFGPTEKNGNGPTGKRGNTK